jgi:hypothetical protein
MIPANVLSVLVFSNILLVSACRGDGTDLIRMPPIDPNSGVLEVDGKAVVSKAKEILNFVELGKPQAIWLLPRVSNPSPDDPFSSGVVKVYEDTLGRLSKEDAAHFLTALEAPAEITARDTGCLWTWVPLMSDKPYTPELGNLEFRFMDDRFCWRVRTTRRTGESVWADLIYSKEFALWVKERMGKVPPKGEGKK